MARRELSTWALGLTMVIGCKGAGEPSPEPTPAPTPTAAVEPAAPPVAEPGSEALAEPGPAEVEAEVLQVLQALGDQGAAVVVVRPKHWAALHEALGPWLATLPPAGSLMASLLEERTGLRRLVARRLGVEPVALEGWDEARSVVISYGEAPYDGPPGAVVPMMPTMQGWLPPARHQIWLPASDPAKLIASIEAALAERGTPFPELVEDRPGARAVRSEGLFVAMLPLSDAVRVVVFEGALGDDEGVLLDHMRRHLDGSPRATAATPARALLVRPDAVASVLVRPWRLRPFASWRGSGEILQALATVSPDWHATAMARGLQIVLDAELLMTDEGAELDDAAQSLVVDDGVLRLRSAMSLTPEGEAVLAAAARGAGQVLAAPVEDAWIDVTLRADVRALLDATEPPPGYESAEAAGRLPSAVQEGGYLATLYMGLRHPFGALRVAERLARAERLPVPIDVLPNATRVVWRGHGEQGPRVVVALHWPEDYVDRPLAGMVPIIKGEPGFESLRMDALRRDGRPVTVFGLGGESATVLDSDEDRVVPGLLRAHVSLARIGADLDTRDPKRAAWLKGAGEAWLTFEHRDRALLGELAWAPGTTRVRPEPVPRLEHERWDSPVGVPMGEGAKCLAQAGRAVAKGLGAASMAAPDEQATIRHGALDEAKESLRCAEAHEDTAEAAAALRRMLGEARR